MSLHPILKNIVRSCFPNVEVEPDINEPETETCYHCDGKFIYNESSCLDTYGETERVFCSKKCRKLQVVIDTQKQMGIVKDFGDARFPFDEKEGYVTSTGGEN